MNRWGGIVAFAFALGASGCECFGEAVQSLPAGARFQGIDPTVAPRAIYGTYLGTLQWSSGLRTTDVSVTIGRSEQPSSVGTTGCGLSGFSAPLSTHWQTSDGVLDRTFDMTVGVDTEGRLEAEDWMRGSFPTTTSIGAETAASPASIEDAGARDASVSHDAGALLAGPDSGVPEVDVVIDLSAGPSSRRPLDATLTIGFPSEPVATVQF